MFENDSLPRYDFESEGLMEIDDEECDDFDEVKADCEDDDEYVDYAYESGKDHEPEPVLMEDDEEKAWWRVRRIGEYSNRETLVEEYDRYLNWDERFLESSYARSMRNDQKKYRARQPHESASQIRRQFCRRQNGKLKRQLRYC